MARLFLNILGFRKSALETEADIESFEKPYELVLMSSITMRDLACEIAELLADHRSKIGQGVGVRIDGRTIHVDEPIDRELRRLSRVISQFLEPCHDYRDEGGRKSAPY